MKACLVISFAALLIPASATGQGLAGLANQVGSAVSTQVERGMGVHDDLAAGAEAAQPVTDAMNSGLETHSALSDLDRQLDGAMANPDVETPDVPSSCLERGPACEECFGRAYEQLARSRVLLARARALFDATHRFNDAAVSHGNNIAPMTKEAAIVWEMQKPRIAASMGQFDATYDRKIRDMLAVVERTLRELSDCEARFYNNPDWYARFGFIYFEFLQNKYQRG